MAFYYCGDSILRSWGSVVAAHSHSQHFHVLCRLARVSLEWLCQQRLYTLVMLVSCPCYNTTMSTLHMQHSHHEALTINRSSTCASICCAMVSFIRHKLRSSYSIHDQACWTRKEEGWMQLLQLAEESKPNGAGRQ